MCFRGPRYWPLLGFKGFLDISGPMLGSFIFLGGMGLLLATKKDPFFPGVMWLRYMKQACTDPGLSGL